MIPDTLPGVGYVILDGQADPIRVRFSHLTDDHIATLTSRAEDTGSWSGPVLEAVA